MPITLSIPRPQPHEHSPYFSRYIDLVPGDDAMSALETQVDETLGLLSRVSEADSRKRYEPGKWSVRQVVGHLCDCERVMGYRALCVARRDPAHLPGFDENRYAETAGSDERELRDLTGELDTIRRSSLALFRSFAAPDLAHVGTANELPITPRALAWIIAGHELHHRKILRERYGLR